MLRSIIAVVLFGVTTVSLWQDYGLLALVVGWVLALVFAFGATLVVDRV